jgi:hypothetical protein
MSYLTTLWGKILLKLGALAGFIKPIADQLKIAISEGDAAKAREINAELREKANDVLALCDKVDEVLSDGNLTITEGSEVALAIEALVD